MSAKRARFYSAKGPNKDAIISGLTWLLQEPGNEAFIAVSVNGILERGYVKTVLGGQISKGLIKDGSVKIRRKTITLITKRREIVNGNGNPILAIYPDKNYLDELDSIPNVSAMMVVPNRFEDINGWAIAHGASDLNPQSTYQVTPVAPVSVVVERALTSMMTSVNEANGVKASGKDRNVCIETFKILHRNGEFFDPMAVKSWLIQNGWKATTAEDALQIARDIINRKKLRSQSWFVEDIIEHWRSRN